MTELETLLLGALKQAAEALGTPLPSDFSPDYEFSRYDRKIELAEMAANEAIAAAEAAQPDEVQREVEAEREACAKVCEDLTVPTRIDDPLSSWITGTLDCATAIRARGNKH